MDFNRFETGGIYALSEALHSHPALRELQSLMVLYAADFRIQCECSRESARALAKAVLANTTLRKLRHVSNFAFDP
jgi:hypothetical protein